MRGLAVGGGMDGWGMGGAEDGMSTIWDLLYALTSVYMFESLFSTSLLPPSFQLPPVA